MRSTLLPLLILGLLPLPVRAADVEVATDATTTSLSGPAFGTAFHVKLHTPADPARMDTLAAQIADAIEQMNARMSLWHETSELSRFNRHTGGEWFEVSAETLQVVEAALQIREQSDGAFDPTV